MEQVSKKLQCQRDMRARRREQGLCVGCGKDVAESKYVYCKECRDKDSARKRNNREKSEETIMKDRLRSKIYKKKVIEERKANGLCVECGVNPPKENRARCAKCLEYRAEESKKLREHRRKYGFCPRCGKNKVYLNESACAECNAEIQEYNAVNRIRYRERHRDYCRMRARELKEKGLCTRCGKRKPKEGCTRCHYCLNKVKQHYYDNLQDIPRSERVAYGRCYVCGKELDRDGRSCKACAEKMAKNMKNNHPKNHAWRRDNNIVFMKRKEKV